MAGPKNNDLSASLEDYLEAIFNIAGQSKIARSKDIAKMLCVSKSSVTGALRVLKEKGLANHEPYGYVTLTRAGQAAAAEIARKHSILKSFFVNVLGIETDVAQEAACKVEHALGPAIITRLLLFIEFMAQGGKNDRDAANEFKRFCEKHIPAEQQRTEPTCGKSADGTDTNETVING